MGPALGRAREPVRGEGVRGDGAGVLRTAVFIVGGKPKSFLGPRNSLSTVLWPPFPLRLPALEFPAYSLGVGVGYWSP